MARTFSFHDSPLVEASETHRAYKLSTGGELHLRKVPQYPLWELSFSSGTLPASLKGRYRSWQSAKAAAEEYFRSHKQRKISITEELKV